MQLDKTILLFKKKVLTNFLKWNKLINISWFVTLYTLLESFLFLFKDLLKRFYKANTLLKS